MKTHEFNYTATGQHTKEELTGTIYIELSKPEVSALKGNRGSYNLSRYMEDHNPYETLESAITEQLGEKAYYDNYNVEAIWEETAQKLGLFIECQDPEFHEKLQVIYDIHQKLFTLPLEKLKQIESLIK